MFVSAVVLRFILVSVSLSVLAYEPCTEAVRFFALFLAGTVCPGLFLYALLRPKPDNPFFPSVFVLSTSLGTTMLTTWILYLTGCYTTTAAFLLEIAFSAAGLCGIIILCKRKDAQQPFFRLPIFTPSECLALIVSLLFCEGIFECVAGTPMTAWDAVVSWDKWASDIASRHALGGYISGAYPQGLPLILSLFYKLMPEGSVPALSFSHLLATGFLQIFPLLLCLSLLSAARSLRINPLWPLGIVLANAGVLHCIIKFNGYADIPLAASVAASIAVASELFSRNRQNGRLAAYVLTTVLFPVAFVKGNGIAVLVLALPFLLLYNRKTKVTSLLFASGAALLLSGIFYLHQWIAGVWTNLGETSPFNHSLVVVATHSNLVSHSLSNLAKQISVWCNFYGFSGTTAVILGALAGTAGLASLFIPKKTRPAGIVSTLVILLWFLTGSYDARNLVFIMPVIALAIPFAVNTLLAPRPLPRSSVTVLFIVLCAFSLSKTRLPEIARRPLGAYTVPNAIRQSPGERRARLLKATEEELAFFSVSSAGRTAQHIVTPTEAYRSFTGKGVYPLQKNGLNNLAHGDIALLAFAGSKPLFGPKPPFVKVSAIRKGFKAGTAIYLYEPELDPTPYSIGTDGEATIITVTDTVRDSGFISVTLDPETPATLELASEGSPTQSFFLSCQDGPVVRMMYWIPSCYNDLTFRLTTTAPANIRKVELGH